MRTHTFEYVFQQVMWLLGTGAQLVASMGVGLKWVFMTFRCITFAMLDLAYFIPHVFWYLLSPNIIRRVSYRSSHTTKLRNLEALLSQQAAPEPAEPSSGVSFAWKDRKGGSRGREATSAAPLSEEPGAIDYEEMERFARTINPADGTFVNGLPVDATDELNNATSFFPGALNMKNSFNDTLVALQRIYRQRAQQQQMAKSTSMNASNNNVSNPAAAADEEAAVPPSPPAESFTDSDNDDDVEDRMNLHNRATLDIYLPIPLDSLFRFMDQERKTSEATTPRPGTNTTTKHASDAKGTASKSDKHRDAAHHNKSRFTRKKFPILISVNGGAWIVGCYLWNFLVARLFAARGYVVFCPDYRNFPQTTMEGMTLDVSDAVAWVLNNAERYNGDLGNVTLIGQSAGAHLTMMSLLSQAQLSAYRSNTMHSTYEGVPPPSDVAYNVPRYNPRESIHRYVGLSGMYNIEGLVDHFQREGLNTPVLHQIAGGLDQLPRYSIHAYFDDCRGGDTGEVLPDNIFDYFPQRMFFVHGDADKCAPVTESASLVAMLRSAQERYALRRRERNEEARRHALRSRRLLPGALAPQAAAVAATGIPTPATFPHRAEAHVEKDVCGGGARRNVHAPAPAARAQWGAGEEDGNDCYGEAEGDHDRVRALYGGYEHLAAAGGGGGGGGRMSVESSVFVSDAATRRSGGLGAATTSVTQQHQQQQQQLYGHPTVVSPIVPPSRTDQPKLAVELEFIVIPNGRHSDAFVDECIAAGRSCCVDLLCDYESAVDCPSRSFPPSLARSIDDDSLCGSVTGAASQWGERVPTWMSSSSLVCAMPDGILPLAVPTEERSFPLRLCTLICPF